MRVDPEADRGRDRHRGDRGQPPVAEALGPARVGDDVGDVGGRGGEQARPEPPVQEGEGERYAVVARDRVEDGEAEDDQAAGDQHLPLAHPVGQGAGEGRGERRRVGEETQE